MANNRKNKIRYIVWLDKSEELSLNQSAEILNRDATSKENGYAMSNIADIILTAKNRGDLIKE